MSCRYSIVVPIYNAEKYLRSCIESIRTQTFQDFELILVDDGSKDSSALICDEYSAIDDRIKVYHKENGGQLHTRQFGIEHSCGEWILFADSDDLFESNLIEIVNDTIEKYNCDGVVFGFRQFDDDDGSTLYLKQAAEKVTVVEDKTELFRLLMIGSGYNAMWSKAIKKSCFQQQDYAELYNIRVAEDKLHTAEIFNNINKVVLIPNVLYNYRCNPAGVMHNIGLDTLIDYTVDEKILTIIKEQNMFSEEDYNNLRTESVKRITATIWSIASNKANKATKVEYLDKLRMCSYHTKFMTSGNYDIKSVGMKYFIYFLFKNRLYNLIFWLRKLFTVK